MEAHPMNIDSIAAAMANALAELIRQEAESRKAVFYSDLKWYKEQSRVTDRAPKPVPPMIGSVDFQKGVDFVLAMHRRDLDMLATMRDACVTYTQLEVAPEEFEVFPRTESGPNPVAGEAGAGFYLVSADQFNKYSEGEEINHELGRLKMVHFPSPFGIAKRWKKIG
jgi:hypothetical protein